jgi:hypothetical protein
VEGAAEEGGVEDATEDVGELTKGSDDAAVATEGAGGGAPLFAAGAADCAEDCAEDCPGSGEATPGGMADGATEGICTDEDSGTLWAKANVVTPKVELINKVHSTSILFILFTLSPRFEQLLEWDCGNRLREIGRRGDAHYVERNRVEEVVHEYAALDG